MRKRVQVNGNKLRQEREKRALTQEQLSEQAGLGIRTLRRLEGGQGSLEAVRRVTNALQIVPEDALTKDSIGAARELIQVDPLTLEIGRELVVMETVLEPLMRGIVEIRKRLAGSLGIVIPGVRFRDVADLGPRSFRVRLYEQPMFEGEAVGAEAPEVIAETLERCIRKQADLLLGIQEVHSLLQDLRQPALVEAVVPSRLDLPGLRAVLRDLLVQGHSIRGLDRILDILADLSPPLPGAHDLAATVIRERAALYNRIKSTFDDNN